MDEQDVRWFDEREVAALAAELINSGNKRARAAEPTAAYETRSPGELAALVFERLEQRQSLAEIVIGLRISPEAVRALFDQWSLGLVDGQLRAKREPSTPRSGELHRVKPNVLTSRLAELPEGVLTRISVARFREWYPHGPHEYALLDELGGFHVSGACALSEITQRYGSGTFRVTAFGFAPDGVRWEVLVEGLDGD